MNHPLLRQPPQPGRGRNQRLACVITGFTILATLLACDNRGPGEAPSDSDPQWQETGAVTARALDEISGIQSLGGDLLLALNDDGPPDIHVINLAGTIVRTITLKPATNRDWEDITIIPTDQGPWLVAGDIGDNHAANASARLYLSALPALGDGETATQTVTIDHAINLYYPDGARDAESMAYDPASDRVLILSKRDRPPRLYGIDRGALLRSEEATLEFLGTMPVLRPPTAGELLTNPSGAWLSQPTAMDISADGTLAAVLTYRSLYLFERLPGEAWVEAFQRPPVEIMGPPGYLEEAVTFVPGESSVIVTTEKLPAPIHRLDLPTPQPPAEP